jgi:hypothetical protein
MNIDLNIKTNIPLDIKRSFIKKTPASDTGGQAASGVENTFHVTSGVLI